MKKTFFSSSEAPVVETAKGKLRGFYYDGVFNFWGVRYAKAKRFHMPEPVDAWEGVKTAIAYGTVCPLLDSPAPKDEVAVPHRFWPESEDCLNLQIWTPTLEKDAKKPVMVWFHGGGYSAGSAIEHIAYEGDHLAKRYGVVVVGVNHRLNAFGHLDMSAYGEQYKNSVNVGIADLVASLEWVRDNIAGFGGDPGNVTIFGQSGGGGKVTTLGQAPSADGLFHKAIVMSGVFPPAMLQNDDNSTYVAKKVLEVLKIDEKEADKLEKVPRDIFIRAVNKASKMLQKEGVAVNWAPKANDWYMGDPLAVGFREAYAEVPTIVGTVYSEFAGFMQGEGNDKFRMTEEEQCEKVYEKFGKETGEKLIALYKKAYPGKNIVFANAVDTVARPASVQYVKAKAAMNKASVYCYNFAADFDFDNGRSAWHCADIPFFFANSDVIPYCHVLDYRARLDDEMAASFVNFASTGDPNGGAAPEWKPCTKDEVHTMVFGENSEDRVNYDDELIAYAVSVTPPFVFHHEEADDEEEGSAWIY